ncbi:MAG: hypothetical protein ACFFCI_12645 [Promethearchaeota archaeon]
MVVKLTDRMKAWIKTGCHLNVATKNGIPFVTVSRNVKSVSDNEIVFALSQDEYSVIESAFSENPWVAAGVSKAGGIRACYQFKGKGTVDKEGDIYNLKVKLSEVYCTKPGCYAGQRLDTKPAQECEEWEHGLWTDLPK